MKNLCIFWKMPVGIFFYSKIIFQHSNIFTGHLQKKRAHGHLFLFPNIFSVFKYFYRASSEKKSLWASLEEKSPWASFSIPKYFFKMQVWLRIWPEYWRIINCQYNFNFLMIRQFKHDISDNSCCFVLIIRLCVCNWLKGTFGMLSLVEVELWSWGKKASRGSILFLVMSATPWPECRHEWSFRNSLLVND